MGNDLKLQDLENQLHNQRELERNDKKVTHLLSLNEALEL
jgi:hypothetical protein